MILFRNAHVVTPAWPGIAKRSRAMLDQTDATA